MFTQRYSSAEMDQWHTAACADATARSHTAPRQNGNRAAMAKGQAEQNQSQRSQTTPAPMQFTTPDDWASECLFDCYNG